MYKIPDLIKLDMEYMVLCDGIRTMESQGKFIIGFAVIKSPDRCEDCGGVHDDDDEDRPALEIHSENIRNETQPILYGYMIARKREIETIFNKLGIELLVPEKRAHLKLVDNDG